ncbi:MAG TPA: carboxypeptidase-like regulatory domain-containing protein [Kofleriaceae bacterium]
MARWCALAIAVAALGCSEKHRDAPVAAKAAPTKRQLAPASAFVTVSGTVIDRTRGAAVGDVTVVLRGLAGDVTTVANGDGTFKLEVVPGSYRAFVRGEGVLALGLTERPRLDNEARSVLAGAADEALMPVLDANRDVSGVELGVEPVAQLSGIVRDPSGRELENAMVRLRAFDLRQAGNLPAVRPMLGTDSALTDEHGHFDLIVPAGNYVLEATHRAYAGVLGEEEYELHAGDKDETQITLRSGCIITGRVVNADGSPANDGALEQLGARSGGFGPAGRIDAGVFRWATLVSESVTLRAWPWHSPPSQPKTFDCSDGKRFNDVVLRLPTAFPDVSGTITDAQDRPVPLAYLDIQPLDPMLGGQQERGDAAGNWHVYDLSPGRYRVTATAPGLGIVDTMLVAPRQDMHLKLGGTGRIVGTTTELANGSVEIAFLFCGSKDQSLQIAHEARIVPVVGGRFTIERAPACTLSFAVRWRDKLIETSTVVEPDRTAYVEVDIGEPRAKTVSGIVRDTSGDAVEGARVTAVLHDREAATARTDAKGHFTLQTHSGAQLVAGKGEHVGRANVGRANVESELIDLVLDDAGY